MPRTSHRAGLLALVLGCSPPPVTPPPDAGPVDAGPDAGPDPCADASSDYCPVRAIFLRSCALSGCHVPGGAAPMSLEAGVAYANLINVPVVALCTAGMVRVAPGDLANSCLWELVSSDEMPLGGPALPAADKEILRAWILAGAPP